MKNSMLFTTLLLGSLLVSSAFADEVNLKRSCVKDYPLVVGETDPSLLNIYLKVCDHKNKNNKNAYLIQAAQQFQQLGQNLKALQLVEQLNAQKVQHSALTDVKFLAGIGVANQALSQIRDQEVRYLSEQAYVPAMALAAAVKKAKPLTVIDPQDELKPQKQSYKAPKAAYKAPIRVKKPAPVKKAAKPPIQTPAVAPKKAAVQNPFEKL